MCYADLDITCQLWDGVGFDKQAAIEVPHERPSGNGKNYGVGRIGRQDAAKCKA